MSKIYKFIKNQFLNLKEEIVMEHPEIKSSTIKKVRAIKENTKHQQVKKHIIEKGSIDSWTAINLYGATRLSAIIFNLRKEGYDIISVPKSSYDRNKELCNFTVYKYNN